MTEQQEQYTELEKEAQKWLDETDTMQFSQMELLTMFAAKKVKDYDLLHNVSNQRELLSKFYIHLSEHAIIDDTCRNDKEMEEAISKFTLLCIMPKTMFRFLTNK